jgi:hypothetical protein
MCEVHIEKCKMFYQPASRETITVKWPNAAVEWLALGKSHVQIPTRRPAILTKVSDYTLKIFNNVFLKEGKQHACHFM